MATLKDLGLKMKEVRRNLDRAKSEAAELQKEWDELRKVTIPSLMEDMDIESVRIEGVGLISLATDAYCTVPAKNKQELQQWMRDNGQGDLIAETINASTLKAWYKEQMLAGNAIPEELVNFNPYTYCKILK